jgi:hypothetical protein
MGGAAAVGRNEIQKIKIVLTLSVGLPLMTAYDAVPVECLIVLKVLAQQQ